MLGSYLLYVALYLGVALTGGSVVHFPLSPLRYGIIGLAGVVIFLLASVLDARRRRPAELEAPGGLGRFLGWSVLLSLGLGMLSGAIQHFLDFPDYAAALLPIGFLFSFVGFLAREGMLPQGSRLWLVLGGAVAVAAVGWLVLDQVAHGIAHGDHAH